MCVEVSVNVCVEVNVCECLRAGRVYGSLRTGLDPVSLESFIVQVRPDSL